MIYYNNNTINKLMYDEAAVNKMLYNSNVCYPDIIGESGGGDTGQTPCYAVTSVVIADSVTSIGGSAFSSCRSLSSITIPDSVTSIGDYALAFCYGLTTVTIGSGTTNIGNNTFSYCNSLTSITCNSILPPTLGGNAVFDNTNNCPIYVPSESVSLYQSANYWNEYSSRIQAIP